MVGACKEPLVRIVRGIWVVSGVLCAPLKYPRMTWPTTSENLTAIWLVGLSTPRHRRPCFMRHTSRSSVRT